MRWLAFRAPLSRRWSFWPSTSSLWDRLENRLSMPLSRRAWLASLVSTLSSPSGTSARILRVMLIGVMEALRCSEVIGEFVALSVTDSVGTSGASGRAWRQREKGVQ